MPAKDGRLNDTEDGRTQRIDAPSYRIANPGVNRGVAHYTATVHLISAGFKLRLDQNDNDC